mgnify:CR=1 FL=1
MAMDETRIGEKYLGSTWKGLPGRERTPDPLLGDLFTQLTPENCGKWEFVEPERGARNWSEVEAMVNYAETHNMLLKYHTLVWGMQQPDWTKTAKDMDVAVDAFMADFFTQYGDRFDLIDVLNEPLSNPPGYRDQLGGAGESGWDWVLWSFRRAREHARENNCKAAFILNDFGLLKGDPKLNRFCGIVELLKAEELIDGVGAQAHYLEKIPTADIKRRLDVLAATGLPIHISEFELNMPDDEQHRKKFEALFTVFWEHPAVAGVTLWGHREGQMWRKHGYLVRRDGSDRPAMTWLRSYLSSAPGGK